MLVLSFGTLTVKIAIIIVSNERHMGSKKWKLKGLPPYASVKYFNHSSFIIRQHFLHSTNARSAAFVISECNWCNFKNNYSTPAALLCSGEIHSSRIWCVAYQRPSFGEKWWLPAHLPWTVSYILYSVARCTKRNISPSQPHSLLI